MNSLMKSRDKLYSQILRGLEDVENGKTRSFSKAMTSIRNQRAVTPNTNTFAASHEYPEMKNNAAKYPRYSSFKSTMKDAT